MNYSIIFDPERFVRKFMFRRYLGISETNFTNWYRRDERFKLTRVPFMEEELVDLDSLVLSPTLQKRYSDKIYFRGNGKLGIRELKTDLENVMGKPKKGMKRSYILE